MLTQSRRRVISLTVSVFWLGLIAATAVPARAAATVTLTNANSGTVRPESGNVSVTVEGTGTTDDEDRTEDGTSNKTFSVNVNRLVQTLPAAFALFLSTRDFGDDFTGTVFGATTTDGVATGSYNPNADLSGLSVLEALSFVDSDDDALFDGASSAAEATVGGSATPEPSAATVLAVGGAGLLCLWARGAAVRRRSSSFKM